MIFPKQNKAIFPWVLVKWMGGRRLLFEMGHISEQEHNFEHWLLEMLIFLHWLQLNSGLLRLTELKQTCMTVSSSHAFFSWLFYIYSNFQASKYQTQSIWFVMMTLASLQMTNGNYRMWQNLEAYNWNFRPDISVLLGRRLLYMKHIPA